MTTTTEPPVQELNHVELVYAPGERSLAAAWFELLGLAVRDRGGPFLSARIEPTSADFANNCLYASEVTAEQWALEAALRAATTDGDLAAPARAYTDRVRAEPQRSFHFGIRCPSLEALEAAVDRIRHAADHAPALVGRATVSGVYRPGDPGAFTDTMVQAFVHTDVVASGLLTFGQHFELQWQVP
ncbi:MAG: hypothetical protein WCI50_10960 [Actinomycetes bacterium]